MIFSVVSTRWRFLHLFPSYLADMSSRLEVVGAKSLWFKTRPPYSLRAQLENKTVFSLLLAQPGFNPLISEPTEPLLFFSLWNFTSKFGFFTVITRARRSSYDCNEKGCHPWVFSLLQCALSAPMAAPLTGFNAGSFPPPDVASLLAWLCRWPPVGSLRRSLGRPPGRNISERKVFVAH